jgi:AcrR family transcriptional regulator
MGPVFPLVRPNGGRIDDMEHDEQDAGRPLRADAARNRERILQAARAVFAERGLDATLDDVAHQAGLGVGTVYRRFASKEDLVEALFAQAITDMVGLAEEAATRDDSWQGLVWFLKPRTWDCATSSCSVATARIG